MADATMTAPPPRTTATATATATTYVYALLVGECTNGDEAAPLTAVVRFDSAAQHTIQEESMYDDVGFVFNSAIRPGWTLDDPPELVKMVSWETAKKVGYVVYPAATGSRA